MSNISIQQSIISTTAQMKNRFTFPRIVKTTESYILYVGDDRASLEYYIEGQANVYGTSLKLQADNLNSSFHIGTVLYHHTGQTFGKHIVLQQGDNLLYDLFVDGETFATHSNSLDKAVELDNGITIMLRDLECYPDHPYEISGIKFIMPE